MTPEQVLAEAESEFARVQRDMYLIARQLWGRYFPKQALPPDDAEGRRFCIDQVLGRVALEHGKPEDLVPDARADVAADQEVHRRARHPPPARTR